MIALCAAAVAGVAVWTVVRTDVVLVDQVRFMIVPPDTAPLGIEGQVRDLTISSDGTQVVFSSGVIPARQLNLQPLNQFAGAPLRGGDGGIGPFVSANGEWVGFIDSASASILQKVSIFGGPPVTLTVSPGPIRGATWGSDDQIIFGTGGMGLFRVSGPWSRG